MDVPEVQIQTTFVVIWLVTGMVSECIAGCLTHHVSHADLRVCRVLYVGFVPVAGLLSTIAPKTFDVPRQRTSGKLLTVVCDVDARTNTYKSKQPHRRISTNLRRPSRTTYRDICLMFVWPQPLLENLDSGSYFPCLFFFSIDLICFGRGLSSGSSFVFTCFPPILPIDYLIDSL